MLRRYSAMVSDNSHLNWSSWITIRNPLVSGVEDLVQRRFLDFFFLTFLFPFLALLLLIAIGAGWGEITRRSGTDSPSLLLWSSLRRHRFLSLYVCVHLSYCQENLHYLPSYFSPNLKKKLLEMLSQIREFRPLHVWITKAGGEAQELGLRLFG